jgi:hypothetical protein
MHRHAHFGKRIPDPDHAAFVARNGAAGEQEAVALAHLEAQVFAAAQRGTGRPAFALAAGDQQHQVAARDFHRLFRR